MEEKDPAKPFVLSVVLGIGLAGLVEASTSKCSWVKRITATVFFSIPFFLSFSSVVIAYQQSMDRVVVIDTRSILWHLTPHWSCYELFSSIKRGFFTWMIWCFGFQHNAFAPRHNCFSSTRSHPSTLIAVVRHLKFIDFIQLALRDRKTAHIKRILTSQYLTLCFFAINTLLNTNI